MSPGQRKNDDNTLKLHQNHNTHGCFYHNLKYYVLPNPAGGIAKARICYGHFDHNNLCTLMEGILFDFHQSFPTEEDAMNYFMTFYPHCKSAEHIKFMKYNAPKEATNLNNPSKIIQDKIGNHPHSSSYKEADYWNTTTMSPFEIKCRESSSLRMHSLGLNPQDSYDFLRLT